jgi:serine protease AprX
VATKALVTLEQPEDARRVRDTGVEVIAEYPDSLLVRGTDAQVDRLAADGIESTPLPEEPVQVTGASFAFEDAVRAQDAVALRPPPGRRAYYLVKLAGPPAPEWLRALAGLGAQVHGTLPGFVLLAGILPERVAAVRAEPWVEEVTPFRPAMKVSPKLRAQPRPQLDAAHLAVATVEDDPTPQLVEVSVFPGESIDEVAERIREVGGTVVTSLPLSLVATLPSAALTDIADLPGIQAILPHALPELTNDRAALVMGIPVDHVFAGHSLTGAGQLVGIADSGLDTGDPHTVHADVRGRVAGLVSWPTDPVWADFVTDPGHDDGPADRASGHGTHVTGSVLGDGAAARAAGATPVPTGTAPQARAFFQAIGQRVQWKTAAQLAAEGIEPPFDTWPPAADGLWGIPNAIGRLFAQAHDAGARIHTNSWGAPVGGVYNANARAVDEFMWEHPDFLLLFSAGNSGVDQDRDGLIEADSIGSPGTAKNCLTVGATENDRPHGSQPPPGLDRDWSELTKYPAMTAAGHVSDDVDGMAAFSSRGPTDDGRVKPDVVAPGTNVLSTFSSVFPDSQTPLWGRLPAGHPLRRLYCWSGGTSMATPLVAGAAALVRQHLLEQRGHAEPSAALLKALLVNGAVPIAGQFPGEVPGMPDPVQGFGRVDVTRCVAPAAPLVFADDPADAVSTGQIRTYRIEAADPSVPLKVTLAWTDAPAPLGSGGLTNQLYLQVRRPDGTVLGGDTTPFPTATNNVQQVVIEDPAPGVYTVRVRGVAVIAGAPGAGPVPRQGFALAVSNGALTDAVPAGQRTGTEPVAVSRLSPAVSRSA